MLENLRSRILQYAEKYLIESSSIRKSIPNQETKPLGSLLLVYHQSYLGEIGVEVKHVEELVQVVDDMRRKRGPDGEKTEDGRINHTKEYVYLDYISDALEKLGFLYFSRDQMKKHCKSLHACKYFVYNSVFDCKAFLDTIGGLLNHHYGLGKRKTEIDLGHRQFLRDLGEKDEILSRKIENHNVWLSKLKEWRNVLIHRHGTPLFPVGKNRFLMSVEPRRLSEAMLLQGSFGDPIEFCEANIRYAHLILEIVLGHILIDLKPKANL